VEIEFSYDKKENKPHYQVNHSDLTEDEIIEVFSNVYVVIEDSKEIKVIGHTKRKKYLVIVGIYGLNGQIFRVITAYTANKKHLIFYKKEVTKNE
jgi:hypothetical protein